MSPQAIQKITEQFKGAKESPAKAFAETTVEIFKNGGVAAVKSVMSDYVKSQNLVRWEQFALSDLIVGALASHGIDITAR